MTDALKRIKISDFPLTDVTLTDEYCKNAFLKEAEYLAAFDLDRLLAGFRATAGLDTKNKEPYPGWENMLIGGHSVGHYAGAAANVVKSPDCPEKIRNQLLSILSGLMNGFLECQQALGTGFLFGAKILDKNNPELQFDNVEKNLTNIITQAWVPWYTMHKLIEGLLCVLSLGNCQIPCGKELSNMADEILSNLTAWIYKRVSRWDEETHRTVLNIEYGGMNDCLYSYYLASGNKQALLCAQAFDDVALFKKISESKEGENILSGRHANTTIPKFIGALNRYVVTGEEEFLTYAKNFWNLVTTAHTYVNGGNSTWEHFGEDNNLYSKLSNCNCETCNSYNMLKLTKLLFMITGSKVYSDWYEHTFINSILSSQNPESGMTTYFQPMASGYFKVFSSPFDSFWCCTGTGMENFSKLGESFYFVKEQSDGQCVLFVNQYISSILNWKQANLQIIQKSYIPQQDFSVFNFDGTYTGKIAFRIPQWALSAGTVKIYVNSCEYDYAASNGYAFVSGTFDSSSEVKIVLPMKISAYNLPDQRDAFAFKYGPVVLCALLGESDGKTAINGVNVAVPEKLKIKKEFIPSQTDIVTVKNSGVEEFMGHINEYLVRSDSCSDSVSASKENSVSCISGGDLRFTLTNTDSNLNYVPHFSQYKQRYGLYFRFLDEQASNNFMEDKLSQGYINSNKLDTVQPGYGQYENDELHNMIEYGTGSVGQTYRGTSRYAKEGGSFSYRMIVDPDGTDLLVMFDPKDNGKTITIAVGNETVYEEKLNCEDDSGFNKVIIPVSKEVILSGMEKVIYEGKEFTVVKITVSGSEGQQSAQLCEFMYTLHK